MLSIDSVAIDSWVERATGGRFPPPASPFSARAPQESGGRLFGGAAFRNSRRTGDRARPNRKQIRFSRQPGTSMPERGADRACASLLREDSREVPPLGECGEGQRVPAHRAGAASSGVADGDQFGQPEQIYLLDRQNFPVVFQYLFVVTEI